MAGNAEAVRRHRARGYTVTCTLRNPLAVDVLRALQAEQGSIPRALETALLAYVRQRHENGPAKS